MSTKQSVILAFMLVFLTATIATWGIWAVNETELKIKDSAMKSTQAEIDRVKDAERKLRQEIQDPAKGIKEEVRKAQDEADAKEKLVYTDTQARKKIFREKYPALKNVWGAQGDPDGDYNPNAPYEPGEGSKAWQVVYDDWTKENAKIKTAVEALERTLSENQKSMDQATTDTQNEKANLETQRRDLSKKLKDSEGSLYGVRFDAENTQDKINKVSREFDKNPEQEKDGAVIFSDPRYDQVVVDIGYQDGARSSMTFFVYSGRHNIPVVKGQIKLTNVRATTSDAVVIPIAPPRPIDPQTNWEATEPGMRYSPLSAAGPEGTEPQMLEKRKTKKEQVDELRYEKIKQQLGQEEADKYFSQQTAPALPPLIGGKGFNPIVAGDWVANTEFTRIVKTKDFAKQVNEELMGLSDVNLGTLTFYFADMIAPIRKDFLGRLCDRNRCKAVPMMSADVDYIVTKPDAINVEVMEQRKDVAKEEVGPDAAKRKSTIAALKEGRKYGAKVITEDQLEVFFLKRQRKSELAKGKAIQPGQHTFCVVGETRLRSVRETNLYIKEKGGVTLDRIEANLDYVVVGGGMTEAKVDLATGRVYYAGQTTPPEAKTFFEAIRTLGLKVLREEELPHFFGLE